MLDEAGIEELSMRARRPAERGRDLPVPHVATKGELMELAVDEVFGEIAVPAAGPDWRADVAGLAGSFRATALRHPWLVSVLGQAGLAYLGPQLMSVTEALASLFSAAGFADPRGALDTVLAYVIGVSTTEAAWLGTVARSGQTEAEFVASLMPAAQQAAAGHEHLAWSAAVAAAEDPAELREARFRSGLDVVLDGLALRLRSCASQLTRRG